jgi:hypothetical protein
MAAGGGRGSRCSRSLLDEEGNCRGRWLRGREQEATRWLEELQRKQALAPVFVDGGGEGPTSREEEEGRRQPPLEKAAALRASRRARRDITTVQSYSSETAIVSSRLEERGGGKASRPCEWRWAPLVLADDDGGRMKRTVLHGPSLAGVPGADGVHRIPTGAEADDVEGDEVARRQAEMETLRASRSFCDGSSRGERPTMTLRSRRGASSASLCGRRTPGGADFDDLGACSCAAVELGAGRCEDEGGKGPRTVGEKPGGRQGGGGGRW